MILLSDDGYDASEFSAREVLDWGLGFHAVAVLDGGKVAVATESAWRAWQLAWRANDPNGSWNTESIEVTREGVRYMNDFGGTVPNYPNDDMIIFPRAEGNDENGNPLYLFPGPWIVWERAEADAQCE